MDLPLPSDEQKRIERERRTQVLSRVAIAAIIISAVITVIAYGFPYLGGTPSNGASSLAVAAGPMPGSALYLVNEEKGTLSPITVMVGGKELHALDAQEGPDGSWYYILNEMGERPVTNLYVQKEDGSVARLTTSSTAKYNLSYDPQSGKLAYQAAADTENLDFLTSSEWDLTIFDPATGEETIEATGTNPALLPGGQALLFKQGTELALSPLGSDTVSAVLSIPSGLYAVDAGGNTLAVYNQLTHKIDIYTLTNGAAPSYREFLDTAVRPDAIAYVNGELVAAYAARRGDVAEFRFFYPALGGADPVIVTALPNGNPQRIYAYE